MPQSTTSSSTVKHRSKDVEENKKKKAMQSTITPATVAAPSSTSSNAVPQLPMMPMYGGMGSMYGGGMYGGGGGGMMGGGPLSGLNQALFGFQSLVLSLGQAVQIVGMNTAALQQLLESAAQMVNHAVHVYKEMRALEIASQNSECLEDKKRRRRLRTLRWCITIGVTYAGYRIIRMAFRKRISHERIEYGSPSYIPLSSSAMTPYSQGYGNSYQTSPYIGGGSGIGQAYPPYGSSFGAGSPYF